MLIKSLKSPDIGHNFFFVYSLFSWECLSLEAVEVKWAALGSPHVELRGQEVVGLWLTCQVADGQSHLSVHSLLVPTDLQGVK